MGIPHLGPLEIGLIVVLVLIVFGVGKLPQVGSALGKGIKEFRKGQQGEYEEKEEADKSKQTKESDKSEEKKQ